MAHVSPVPLERTDPAVQQIMQPGALRPPARVNIQPGVPDPSGRGGAARGRGATRTVTISRS